MIVASVRRLTLAAALACAPSSASAFADAAFDGIAALMARASTSGRFERLPATDRRPAMLPIAPGDFTMGSPAGEAGRFASEPLRPVRLTRGFWMAETETSAWHLSRPAYPPRERGSPLEVIASRNKCLAPVPAETSAWHLSRPFIVLPITTFGRTSRDGPRNRLGERSIRNLDGGVGAYPIAPTMRCADSDGRWKRNGYGMLW